MLRILLVIVVIAGLAGVVRAQSVRSAATLDDLLTEMRSLRSDLNRVSAAAIRAQVLATRLRVQEERIRTVAVQIAEADRTLAGVASERRMRIAHLKQLQDLRRAGNLSAAQIGDVDETLKRLGQEVEQSASDEQALRDGEQELRRSLSAEQNLWTDFNSRMEELERVLAAAHRP